jgi:hypothetical protein
MKIRQLLILASLISLLCAPANLEAASIQVTIDGQSVNVPLRYEYYANRIGGWYEVVPNQGDAFVWETSEGGITLRNTELHPDPTLIFASVALDFGAPSSFSYTFTMPLAPTVSNPSFVSDSFAGSVTNGATAGGVTVTALPPVDASIPVDGDGVTEMQVYTLSDDGGTTWKNVGLDVGTTEVIPLDSFLSAPTTSYNLGPIPTIPHAVGMPWTHMRADITFRLSGGGDVFTFNGAKVLVPEPSTILGALLLIGMSICRRPSAH